MSVLPADVPFDMFPGTDAKAAAGAAAEGDSPVDALEQRTGCRVYRDWPITETSDVRRCYPELAHLSDAEAWVEYERTFSRLWRRDRARLYIDFFCRHLTLGDVGAALSHLRVAERAHAEGLGLQVVLEDDAHLTDEALPALLREVQLLEAAGVRWDLIYLGGSALYSKGVEPAVTGAPDSCLRVAGHRKVCMAYALSADGARKLATCGFRESVFPVDDLLPALHSRHPRADVMALACVRAARWTGDGGSKGEDGEAEDEGGGDETEESGFVALTFPDDAGLVRTRQGAGSDSKAGSGSVPLLGDCGVAVDCSRGEEAEVAERPAELATAAAAETGAAEAPQPAAALSRGEAEGGGLAAQLRQRGYCRVLLSGQETAALREAEATARALLSLPEAKLRRLSFSAEARRGRARDCGGSDLLNAGFSRWECRLQWHVVCGAPDAQLWPHEEQPHARSVLLDAANVLRDHALWCLDCLARDGGGCDWATTLRRDCAALGPGTDGSVLDAFVYRAERRAGGSGGGDDGGDGGDALLHMGSHTDPGVLTLKLASATAGLQVRDGATGGWVDLESGGADELLVLAADALEHASGAAIRAAPHRVAAATNERLSLVYEMRVGPNSKV